MTSSVDPDETPSHLSLNCLLKLSGQIRTVKYSIGKIHAQTGKIMTKSSVITNRLSVIMAGMIIDYLFSSD